MVIFNSSINNKNMEHICVKGSIFLLVLFLGRNNGYYTVDAKNSNENGNNKEYNQNYFEQPKKQQNYYQDIYVAQLVPEVIEFGHVKEAPFSWEQRFERINLDDNRHQGKVKWNDPKHGYGELYYDYDHDKGTGDEEDKQEEEKKQTLDDILADGRRLLEKGDVEFIDGKSYDTLSNGQQSYHGGNYKIDPNQANRRNGLVNDKYKSNY